MLCIAWNLPASRNQQTAERVSPSSARDTSLGAPLKIVIDDHHHHDLVHHGIVALFDSLLNEVTGNINYLFLGLAIIDSIGLGCSQLSLTLSITLCSFVAADQRGLRRRYRQG